MTITLSALIGRLQDRVTAYNGVPNEAQYAQVVKDAVADLSLRRPIMRTATLEVVKGQAEYELPADFIRLVSLTRSAVHAGGVVVNGAQLIPTPTKVTRERHDVSGRTLTIYPTPAFNSRREMRYAAGFVLDDGVYPALTDELANAALLKAEEIALRLIAKSVARDAWTYREGDQVVDKRDQVAAYHRQADAALEAYNDALKALSHTGLGFGTVSVERTYPDA